MWYQQDHFKAVRGISDRAAAFFDWTTPNLLTFTGLLLTVPMAWCLWYGHLALGVALFLASITTDWLDGSLARYQDALMTDEGRAAQERRFILFRRGKTDARPGHFHEWLLAGTNLDPMTDKLRYFLALAALGWPRLPHWIFWLALGFGLVLTLGRPLVVVLGRGKPHANLFGKFKAIFEGILIFALVFLPLADWSNHVCLGLFGLATLGGACSAGGQVLAALRKK